MKSWFSLLYWIVMIVAIGLVQVSFSYSFVEALFVSVCFLPCVLLVEYFYRQLSFRRPFDLLYFALAVLFTQYLLLLLAHALFFEEPATKLPGVLLNPVFIWLVLFVYLAPMKLIGKYLSGKSGPERKRFVEFVSDRRRVSVEVARIAYIESNDDEVWLYMHDGQSYRNKTNITHWERELGDPFLRTHRSFLVNTEVIERYDESAVYIAGNRIDISRKYRPAVQEYLEGR
ncbi:MAG: LytTR family transcriptional regulator [Rikenellaceae bacterium]|nr:LytTR family transcriptional regulator [Rikenellaceae bacterium]